MICDQMGRAGRSAALDIAGKKRAQETRDIHLAIFLALSFDTEALRFLSLE